MAGTRKKPSEVVTPLYTEPAGGAEVYELAPPPPPEPTMADLVRARLLVGSAVLTLPRTEWLVKGWIPKRAIGVGFGAPGSGKSFYALSMALTMAEGGYWAGQPVEASRVLYLAAERAEVLADRQEAWTLHTGRTIPSNFVELPMSVQLLNPEHLGAVCEVVAELRPALVVIDTLAQTTLGVAENDGKEWGNVAGALGLIRDATAGGSVFAVHHTGKSDDKGMRGHTVLLGAVDYTVKIAGDPKAISAKVDKINAAAKPLPEWYRLEAVPMAPLPGQYEDRSGAVLVHTQAAMVGTTRADELLPIIVGSYADTGVTNANVREALACESSAAGKYLTALVNRGHLTVTGKGPATRYHLTTEGRAAASDAPAELELG